MLASFPYPSSYPSTFTNLRLPSQKPHTMVHSFFSLFLHRTYKDLNHVPLDITNLPVCHLIHWATSDFVGKSYLNCIKILAAVPRLLSLHLIMHTCAELTNSDFAEINIPSTLQTTMECVSKGAFYKELETYKQNQKRNSSQITLFIEDKFLTQPESS